MNANAGVTSIHITKAQNAVPVSAVVQGPGELKIIASGGLTKLEHVATLFASAMIAKAGNLYEGDTDLCIAWAGSMLKDLAELQKPHVEAKEPDDC